MEHDSIAIFPKLLEGGLAVVVILYDHKISRLWLDKRGTLILSEPASYGASFRKGNFCVMPYEQGGIDLTPCDFMVELIGIEPTTS